MPFDASTSKANCDSIEPRPVGFDLGPRRRCLDGPSFPCLPPLTNSPPSLRRMTTNLDISPATQRECSDEWESRHLAAAASPARGAGVFQAGPLLTSDGNMVLDVLRGPSIASLLTSS